MTLDTSTIKLPVRLGPVNYRPLETLIVTGHAGQPLADSIVDLMLVMGRLKRDSPELAPLQHLVQDADELILTFGPLLTPAKITVVRAFAQELAELCATPVAVWQVVIVVDNDAQLRFALANRFFNRSPLTARSCPEDVVCLPGDPFAIFSGLELAAFRPA